MAHMGAGGGDVLKRRTKTKQASIVSRIVVPLLLAALAQSALVVGMFVANGIFEQLRASALNMLYERTQNKCQSLQTEMTLNWSTLSGTEEKVLAIVKAVLAEKNKSFASIRTDAALNAELSLAVSQELISRMRENDTTGAFIIFNGIGVVGREDTFAGVYVRDTDPYTDAADNSDLHVLRGLPPLTRALGLSLDSFWQASFTFAGEAGSPGNSYFYMPLYAARQEHYAERPHDGYWSMPFHINGEGDGAVVTYSEPLLDDTGEPYGVIGVELNMDYLISVLNQGEFARASRGCYFLGMSVNGGKSYRLVATGGAKYKQFFRAEDQTFTPLDSDGSGMLRVRGTRDNVILRGALFDLQLYPSDSFFAPQQWALIGLEDEETLLSFANMVRNFFVVAACVAVIVGAGVSLLTSRAVVRPIVRLAHDLQTSDPSQELSLAMTGITEIDRLTEAILALHHDVTESTGRLSRVLRLAGLSVGVFEIRQDSDLAYCSDGVFKLLGREDSRGKKNLIPKQRCLAMVEAAMADRVEEATYRVRILGAEHFVRIKQMQEENATIGTVLDVTAELEDRRRIERERDHDLLTGILNRRAFESGAEGLFIQKGAALGIAAVVMLDLDNLKFLNDTYGHDCGDGYIRSFAESLRLFGAENTLIARRSGDEFYVLLYGGRNREELRERIRAAWEGITERTYQLPDGTPYKMRVSAGVAWYPDDARTLAQLIHYADFAMYQVKRSAKGTLEEFSRKDYSEDSFLISGRDALDRLIDQQLVRFALQPILSARTGDVYGFELLMRTNVRELPDPTTVLRLAGAEGKLPNIERLTWLKGLETVKLMMQNRATPPGAVFFINSIANQQLAAEDERFVEERYASLLPRLVIEVTESERNDKAYTQRKLAFVRGHGGRIAIDDYGTGYNSEVALIQIGADIVKLDISFVRGVDTDPDKQALIQNLISYARARGIAVVAEGVETREELRTLIRFRVDYLQGYYLGQPQYQPMNPDKLLRREIQRIVAEMESDGA